MSATWTKVREEEYSGRGLWMCWGCKAQFAARTLPPILRFTRRDGLFIHPSRALCAHCAEHPPAMNEVDVVPRGRVIAWEP